MKKALPVLLGVIIAGISYAGVVSFFAQTSVQAATSVVKLYVNPASLNLTLGQTGSVQLRLSKNSSAKVDYVDARVTFSTTHLEVTSISKQGSYFNYSGGPNSSYNNSNGTLTVSGSGPEMATSADALIATITFKGKAVGTGSISYTSASQAGDRTNGGHVKNVLDTRVGGVISVLSPPSSVSSGNSTPPSSGPTPAVPATTGEASDTPSSTTPTQQESQTAQNEQVNATPTTAVAETIEEAVTKPPVWLQYLLPGAALLGVLGFAGLGWVLYRKRQQDSVKLPPAEEGEDPLLMPSTEKAEEGLGIPLPNMNADEAGDDASMEPDLPEFSTLHSEVAPLPPIPASLETLDSVLQQEPELLPNELRSVPDVQPAAFEPQVAEPVAPSPPQSVPVVPPAPPEQLAVPSVAQSVWSEPITTPNVLEAVTPPPQSQAVMSAPAPVSPVIVTEPTPQPFQSPAAESVTPVSPPFSPTTAAAQLSQTDNVDYANMPDMFDIGAQRLQNEGLTNLRPAGR